MPKMPKINRRIGISELVLRDGHQSLIATRMKTEDMLPICAALDSIDYWSLEVWGGATFDSCVRFLREDPWQRLRALRQALPNSRLQMLLRGQNLLGYRHYANDVVAAFVQRAADCGMDVFRVFDALNDFNNVKVAIAAVKKAGKHAQGTICYTTSPVHNTAGFVRLAEKFAAAGCRSIAIKDMAGIMTPVACGELVATLKARVSLPVHVHSHDTSGLAGLCLLRAAEAGADVIDTAISAFAGGASHPATETMHTALVEMGYDTELQMDQLTSVAAYFRGVRKKYWQFESDFTRIDPAVLAHHVPGGMISNLTNQLQEQNALDKIDEVLAEIPRVRADLGYPPLVTPTSQIVGAQATLNVLSGERYANISQEIKQYLQGGYGKIPGKVSEQLAGKISAADGARSVASREVSDEMDKLTAEIGGIAKSKEDVLIYAMFPDIGKVFLQERAAGKLQPPLLLPPPGGLSEATSPDIGGIASEYRITIHGETYDIRLTGVGSKDSAQRPLFFMVDGVSEEALVEMRGGFSSDAAVSAVAAADVRPLATEKRHVTTTMPGTVVAVLVSEGDRVQVGAPVLVIEAMKMENEIQSLVAGKVGAVMVTKGDTVCRGELLIDIIEE